MTSQAEAPRNILCAKTAYGFREKENQEEGKGKGRSRRGFKEKFCFVELSGKMCGT
jgi:hypothetical protein